MCNFINKLQLHELDIIFPRKPLNKTVIKVQPRLKDQNIVESFPICMHMAKFKISAAELY